uniref:Uncharacterized protein n=2 Tax=Panagrellus redivivus TaxID=6233 RepID=A0A7E4UZD4_PANRE
MVKTIYIVILDCYEAQKHIQTDKLKYCERLVTTHPPPACLQGLPSTNDHAKDSPKQNGNDHSPSMPSPRHRDRPSVGSAAVPSALMLEVWKPAYAYCSLESVFRPSDPTFLRQHVKRLLSNANRRRSNSQFLRKDPCHSTAQLEDHMDFGRFRALRFGI